MGTDPQECPSTIRICRREVLAAGSSRNQPIRYWKRVLRLDPIEMESASFTMRFLHALK
jgi:hypothetical protein